MTWVSENVESKVADFLFQIRLTALADRVGVFQKDVRNDVAIDYEMLEEQLISISEIFVFWELLLAEQKSVVSMLESQVGALRGSITRNMLDESRRSGLDIRRADLEDLIDNDDKMVELKVRLILEKKREDKVKAVVNGIRIKSDALRSLAGFKREERRDA